MVAAENSLQNIVSIIYITSKNSKITALNDFLKLELTAPNDEGIVETKIYDRIYLHRAFPFDYPYEYISVMDSESKEIGLISKIDNFDEKISSMLKTELDRKYYAPIITKIISIKERYGFSYWTTETSSGEVTFSLRDTYASILKINSTRIFIIDINGNRYEIPNIEELDRNSYKKIELYL